MHACAGVSQLVVVADMGGFSDAVTDLASFVDLAQSHYPERLALAVLSRPPTLFWLAWTAAQVCGPCCCCRPRLHALVSSPGRWFLYGTLTARLLHVSPIGQRSGEVPKASMADVHA